MIPESGSSVLNIIGYGAGEPSIASRVELVPLLHQQYGRPIRQGLQNLCQVSSSCQGLIQTRIWKTSYLDVFKKSLKPDLYLEKGRSGSRLNIQIPNPCRV